MNSILDTPVFNDWRLHSLILFVGVLVPFLARHHAHLAISGMFRMLSNTLRLTASALDSTRKQLKVRNREVLLEQGKMHEERDFEREFFEISRFVQRDLGGYPQLQRQIQEEITTIHDDYQHSGEVPPALPEWQEAVDAVAKIKSGEHSNSLNNTILEQIHQSAEQHKDLLQQRRLEVGERHKTLKAMTSHWRKLTDSVDEVGGRLKEIITRSQNIDQHIAKFNQIVQASVHAVRALRASSITQFLIAFIVMSIAAGGPILISTLLHWRCRKWSVQSSVLVGLKWPTLPPW